MGGGVLMTPLLIIGFGLPASAAVATDLAYASITKVNGAGQHRKQGTINWPIFRALALGSIPGTLAAAFLLSRIAAHDI